MKLVFCGSPDFAVPTLRSLHAEGHGIVMVVTRPERPRGRSGRPVPTAVKEEALELGLAVYEPQDVNAPESVRRIREAGADLGVVVAFGQILSEELLAAPGGGFLNVHASLLPKYRGAAPVNWAIIRGETATGVSIIRVEPRLDAGPVLARQEVQIGPDETAGELADRLADIGAEALTDVVGRLDAGERLIGEPQAARGRSYAPKLAKADGKLDWRLTTQEIRNRVRGLTPWPGAYGDLATRDGSTRVTLLRVQALPDEDAPGEPGTVLRADAEGILVQAGGGAVLVEELQPAGRRAMKAADFLNGHPVAPGDRFE